ncbi:LysE family translocator [Modestobacter sp. Leaf380]|uniref:LysE family translocator n=1 Tax=Modestobacter sp. Leaf380 TaxID=1736356 RepID=UPI0006F5D6B2|nr:LysE family transporter [Modestobacter sp. Leaf380]KQS66660.1 hypothetical protein ASG41_09345 [Modestobacter sp. Leaf380]
MGEVFLLAMGIGLIFNAAPGAVFTESLRRGVREGFPAALAVQLGSLVGDAAWAIAGLAGIGALFTVPGVRVGLTVTGCALLCWLGISSIIGALRAPAPAPEQQSGRGRGGVREATVVGVTMSLANPWNIVYWAGAASAVSGLSDTGGSPGWTALSVFFAGFMTASVGWAVICAAGIAVLRRALNPTAVRVVEFTCGIALLGLAVALALRSASGG